MLHFKDANRDENGRLHGEIIFYYHNNKIDSKSNYYHGFLHGLHESYYHNGDLYHRGYWNMGKKTGYSLFPTLRLKSYHLWVI